RFGTVMVARAYADWQRQPEFFKGSLTAAMIDRVDCPSKVRERFRQNPYFPQPSPYDRVPPRDAHLPADEYAGDEQALNEEAQSEGNNGTDELPEQVQTPSGELNGVASDEVGYEDRRQRYEPAPYGSGGYSYGNGGGFYAPQPQQVITQSTVDLNMLMD